MIKFFTTTRIMSKVKYFELNDSFIDELVCFQNEFSKDLNENTSNHFTLKKSQIFALIACS